MIVVNRNRMIRKSGKSKHRQLGGVDNNNALQGLHVVITYGYGDGCYTINEGA